MSDFRDILRVQGVKARGYGIIPKMVMLDRKLPIESKAIYSYFCSYAGAGDTAFPRVEKIYSDLGISKTRYYKYLQYLVDYGYIKIEQVKIKGKFSHNIYTLLDKPNPVDNSESEREKPCPQNKDTVESKKNTDVEPCPQNGDTRNGDTGFEDTNINSLSYNQQSSLLLSVSQEEKDRLTEHHQFLCGKCRTYLLEDDKDVKLIENTIMDLMYMKEIKNKDRIYNHTEIMDKLNKLDIDICYYAMDKFKEASNETNIKNKSKYFSVLLFNAIDEYYAN